MPYLLELPAGQTGITLEQAYAGKAYTVPGATGTQCVSFLKAAIPALSGKTTKMWIKGDDVKQGISLDEGTAIATFVNGAYPQNATGHAAVYLSQNDAGIQVLDQWATQGKVLERTIRWVPLKPGDIVNDANAFSVVE
jgi:hypothetical protein